MITTPLYFGACWIFGALLGLFCLGAPERTPPREMRYYVSGALIGTLSALFCYDRALVAALALMFGGGLCAGLWTAAIRAANFRG